jgi:arsenate reductase (glutaredoxin)
MTTVFGIPNCDTVKRARAWLAAQGHAYTFHDYKRAGVPADRLRAWVARLGWEALLNRQGTTFRKLPDEERIDLDEERSVALMLAHPSAIRRPVVEHGDMLLVGFAPERWAIAFG